MLTNRQLFYAKYKIPESTSLSIQEISKISGVPLVVLNEVARRGRNAYSNNLASVRLKKDFSKNPNTTKYPASERISANAWQFGRIFSFIMKGKTYYTADSDLVKK